MSALQIGRGLMLVAALAAVAAFAKSSLAMAQMPADRLWVECWRTFGFLVFAGLFALLAWRPTRSPLVWELVFLHKAALVAARLVIGDVPEATLSASVDLAMCAIILSAWVLTRGWRSWSSDNGSGHER